MLGRGTAVFVVLAVCASVIIANEDNALLKACQSLPEEEVLDMIRRDPSSVNVASSLVCAVSRISLLFLDTLRVQGMFVHRLVLPR
jgi:hypothetical protein